MILIIECKSIINRNGGTHFVKRCTNCLMIWNRDTNAWRNMIYLAKEEHAGREWPAMLVVYYIGARHGFNPV